MANPLIYLATPYSDPDPAVITARFESAARAAGKLLAEGKFVFSPISHCHPIKNQCDLPNTWEFWGRFDRYMLGLCGKVVVVKMPGWDKSVGVAAEIEFAREFDIPVEYMEPVE
jgi:hypothetical protein